MPIGNFHLQDKSQNTSVNSKKVDYAVNGDAVSFRQTVAVRNAQALLESTLKDFVSSMYKSEAKGKRETVMAHIRPIYGLYTAYS